MNQARDTAYVQHLIEAAAQHKQDVALRTPWPYPCVAPECERAFRDESALRDHAEAVHTFEDIRRILSEVLREKFGRRGDYKTEPIVPTIWVWIDDFAVDWVVFMVEEGNDSQLLKASYVIVDGVVTLGEPYEVRRRTVYEPVVAKKDDED